MSDDLLPFLFFVALAFIFGGVIGSAVGEGFESRVNRERFLTFCTEQGLPYAKCKEEWEKP